MENKLLICFSFCVLKKKIKIAGRPVRLATTGIQLLEGVPCLLLTLRALAALGEPLNFLLQDFLVTYSFKYMLRAGASYTLRAGASLSGEHSLSHTCRILHKTFRDSNGSNSLASWMLRVSTLVPSSPLLHFLCTPSPIANRLWFP